MISMIFEDIKDQIIRYGCILDQVDVADIAQHHATAMELHKASSELSTKLAKQLKIIGKEHKSVSKSSLAQAQENADKLGHMQNNPQEDVVLPDGQTASQHYQSQLDKHAQYAELHKVKAQNYDEEANDHAKVAQHHEEQSKWHMAHSAAHSTAGEMRDISKEKRGE